MMSKQSFIQRAKIIILICALMVGVHIFNFMTLGYFLDFGLYPRDIFGLLGIITSPFMHSDISHLFGNLSILVVLSFVCLIQGTRFFVKASFWIILLSGAMLWVFGRDGNHIGASSWIFGLWSLVISLAWFDRSILNIMISIATIFFYGGLVVGLMPTGTLVSFEGHIFGVIAGVISAVILSKDRQKIMADNRIGELTFWS